LLQRGSLPLRANPQIMRREGILRMGWATGLAVLGLLMVKAHDGKVQMIDSSIELENGAVVIADKAYDADNIRAHIRHQGAVPNIPNRSNRKTKYRWTKALHRERNRVERFFNRLKQFRRIATRYDKLGANFFAFVKLASMRIWLRSIESTP
jgi:transposase